MDEKKTLKKEITLLDVDGKEFTVRLLPLSFYVKSKLLDAKIHHTEEVVQIDKVYGVYTDEEFQEKIKDPEFILFLEKKARDAKNAESEFVNSIMRIVVDERSLNEKNIAFNWSDQDYELMEEVANSFRERVGI